MNTRTASILAICLPLAGQAQPIVDIGAFPNLVDTTLEIKLRPHQDFGEVVSGLTFTLRWPEALGAGFLGSRVLGCPDALVINPVAIQQDTGYYSRTFNSFGTELLSDWGCGWFACEEHMVMYLPAASTVGLDQVDIPPGSYVIYLGGMPVPGDIYPWGPCATAIEHSWPNAQPEGAMVFPIPADNEIILSGGRSAGQPARLIACGTDGRQFELASLGRGRWNVTGLPPGIYLLHTEGVALRFVKR